MRAGFELHPLARIDRHTIHVHRPMYVRTRGTPGRADVTNHIARGHMLAHFGLKRGHVQVNRFYALAVINRHGTAAQIPLLDNLDHAWRDGMNGRTSCAALIDACVKIARQFAVMQAR